jgi:hypothetical protein
MPTTQSNKQSQKVSVVVNNNNCCKEVKKRRKRRQQPPRPPPQEPQVQMPIPVIANPRSQGIAALAPRPMIYSPITSRMMPENSLGVPSYFERELTNQQYTIENMRKDFQRELDDVQSMMQAKASRLEHLSQIEKVSQSALSSFDGMMQPPEARQYDFADGGNSIFNPLPDNGNMFDNPLYEPDEIPEEPPVQIPPPTSSGVPQGEVDRAYALYAEWRTASTQHIKNLKRAEIVKIARDNGLNIGAKENTNKIVGRISGVRT